MAELKTKKTDESVVAFLDKIEYVKKRLDCYAIVNLMKSVTGYEPKMWGESIVGFGSYHYKYATGHEGDMPLAGFAPRKNNLTIYIMPGFERYPELMSKLGKFKTGKSCLYIKSMNDVDPLVLRELIKESVQWVQAQYPPEGNS
jgi:hypothetical protein